MVVDQAVHNHSVEKSIHNLLDTELGFHTGCWSGQRSVYHAVLLTVDLFWDLLSTS